MHKKPSIFSKVFRFIIIITVVALLSFILTSYGVPKLIIIALIIVSYLVFTAFWPAHIIYKSKSIKAIGRYINNNHKRPIFGYSYALATGTDQDVEVALKRIMNTYTEEDMHDIYGANLAIHQNNSQALLRHAEKIKSDDHRYYFKAYAYILKGKFMDAIEFSEKVRTPWMIHSLKAADAKKRRDLGAFKIEANKSIESALGIQRFVLFHTMRRLGKDTLQ
ncbi:hypothetical protein [Sporosarcina jiandibaonis]|uniref:hypothetical protein n=1 Tax=Sporosarcina jiandibaonis TaxID=2715535 RepID=UPI0015528194|nr:hypothetical protein [Sporosarcina jiandibaonis]